MDTLGGESSDSCDDETIRPVTIRDQEPNIKSVHHCFLKTGKSTGDGILATHHMRYRFYKRNSNGKKEIIWWDSCVAVWMDGDFLLDNGSLLQTCNQIIQDRLTPRAIEKELKSEVIFCSTSFIEVKFW